MAPRLRISICAALLVLGACNDDSEIPAGFPGSNVMKDDYGAVYFPPAVTTDLATRVYWAQELVEDYRRPGTRMPTLLAPSALDGACGFPAPSPEALVAFVEIHGGKHETPLFLVNREDIAAMRKAELSPDSGAAGEPPHPAELVRSASVGQVDVFVTETTRPVYLMLAAHDETLWSLQLAEGARLDGVAVFARRPQALANAPEDARLAFTVRDGSQQRRCFIPPQRPVDETWRVLEKVETETEIAGTSFRYLVEKATREHAAFRSWIGKHIRPPDTAVSAYRTGHVLIGPKPARRQAYRPLEGATVLFSANAVPVWGENSDAEKAILQQAAR